MKNVHSAYVAQHEVSHSYDKGVPKNITHRTHSYQHKLTTRTGISRTGFGLVYAWSLIFAN